MAGQAPGDSPRFTRRGWLGALIGASAWGQGRRGEIFEPQLRRYADPTTELEVIRITDPGYASFLTAEYNRDISRASSWMIFCCGRTGSPQAFRMDLKTGETRQLTDVPALDASSLTLTPDNRSFCYCAGRSLFSASAASLRERQLYSVPEDWERCPGMSAGPDGTHAVFAEQKADMSRLRMVSLAQGAARTVIEAPFAISHPQARPNRAQLLYRQGSDAVWMVNMDGQQNRKLKLAPGRVAGARWSPDGHTILYLNIPEDRSQLNAIREFSPDSNTDKLVAKTSQYASFGFNRDTSVFVGASANKASPVILILLRITRRELTLCEHRSSDPSTAAPRFSPDSQHIYFQSDKEGKPAIYSMHVDRLVERTEPDAK